MDPAVSLAAVAACFTDSRPVRISPSMLRRMFWLSTLTQFFACGTNQLFRAARSFTLFRFNSDVVLGTLPFAWRVCSAAVLVKSRIQSSASALSAPIGTARSEPPRKPGMTWPFTWLGIANWAVVPVYFLPTQHVYQTGPPMDAARP